MIHPSVIKTLNQVNLNHFRVFEAIYRHGSVSKAAEELHLTQSGVSQHLQSLETQLAETLFQRTHRKIVPTEKGKALYVSVYEALSAISGGLLAVKQWEPEIAGNLSIGLPIEYGNNVVIPKLAEFGTKYPEVNYKIQLDYASRFNSALLNGELDLAIADSFNFDSRLKVAPIATENLLLCAHKDLLQGKNRLVWSAEYFEKQHYIEYQVGAPILRQWFRHHLRRRHLHLKVRATVMDVQAIGKFILSGLGFGVLPDHLVERLKSGHPELVVIGGDRKPLKNTLNLVYRQDVELPHSASALVEFLKSHL